MKRFIILLLFVSVSISSQAQQPANEISLKETIKKVTVYLSSAQIEGQTQAVLPAGENNLVITNLPSRLIPGSVQVSGTGNFTILSVETHVKKPEEVRASEKTKKLTDSLDQFNYLIEMESIKKYALDQEESLLLSNKNLSGKDNASVDVEDMANLYRNRLPELKREMYKVNKELIRLSKLRDRINADINRLVSGNNNAEIIVSASSRNQAVIELSFSYLVPDAYWYSSYDIRVKDINSPIELIHKAEIVQSSGVDWNNVKLVLSTGNPTENTVMPVLRPYVVNFISPTVYERVKPVQQNMSYAKAAQMDMAAAAPEFIAQEQTINTNYTLQIPYSVPSDGQAKTVEVSKRNVPAGFTFSSIPKLDAKAYLNAKISNWDTLDLISAKANIYFNNAFVGQTMLNSLSSDDTLNITLGSDKDIIVKRTKLREMSKGGSTKKVNMTYQLDIRNTKSKEIMIELEDQIPLPQDKSIEVKLLSSDGAQFDPSKNSLKWYIRLNPSETKSLKFSYELRYPKDKIITGY